MVFGFFRQKRNNQAIVERQYAAIVLQQGDGLQLLDDGPSVRGTVALAKEVFGGGERLEELLRRVVGGIGDEMHPQADAAIRWDDADLAIDWPVSNPSLSGKDAAAPFLADIPADRLPPWEG